MTAEQHVNMMGLDMAIMPYRRPCLFSIALNRARSASVCVHVWANRARPPERAGVVIG